MSEGVESRGAGASGDRSLLIAVVVWCVLLLAGCPDDVALSWDETDHVGAVFHYRAFVLSLVNPLLHHPAWTDFGDWGAGVAYYPPTYALLLGAFTAIFGLSLPVLRAFTILQGGLALLFLGAIIRRYASVRTARLGVALTALLPIFIVYSRRFMLDVPQVCFLLGCFYYLVCVETGTEPIGRRMFTGAAILWFGFAALTRITAAPFVLGPWALWWGLRALQRSTRPDWRRQLSWRNVVPLAVCGAALVVWLLTGNVLRRSLALHGTESFLSVFQRQSPMYLDWFFRWMDPFWGRLWLVSVVWCLVRRGPLHFLALAMLIANHLLIASLHNPAGMDYRFYLPAMPLMCAVAADLLDALWSRLSLTLHSRPRLIEALATVLIVLGIGLGRWRANVDAVRKQESRSTGVLAAVRDAAPRIPCDATVGLIQNSGAKFYLSLLSAPKTLRYEETLAHYRDANELPSSLGWLVFDTGELDRGPHLADLLASVQRSSDWELVASAAGTSIEDNPWSKPSGFVFRRTASREKNLDLMSQRASVGSTRP